MMMRALKAFEYNYRRVKAGEMFEALSDAHRMVLAAAKLAVEDDAPERKKQRYRHRKLEAEG
jgi:hypothetical protein